MWARLFAVVLVTACYSPKLTSGTPCTPSLANCPGDQFCALVDGDYYCVTELPGIDASTVDTTIGEETPDATTTPDGSIATPKWMLARSSGSMGNDTNFGATSAGNTIIVGVETSDGDAVNTVTDNIGNTYARIPGSRALSDSEDLAIELWIAKTPLAGVTRVTATGDTIFSIVIWEVAGLDKTNPIGTVTRLQDQDETNSPSGAPITTTSPGQFVLSIAIVGNMVSGLKAGSAFTNDQLTYGNGWAHLTSNTAPAGTFTAIWDQPNSADYCAVSATFRLAP